MSTERGFTDTTMARKHATPGGGVTVGRIVHVSTHEDGPCSAAIVTSLGEAEHIDVVAFAFIGKTVEPLADVPMQYSVDPENATTTWHWPERA